MRDGAALRRRAVGGRLGRMSVARTTRGWRARCASSAGQICSDKALQRDALERDAFRGGRIAHDRAP